jgi:hypothetical protein
VANRSLPAAHHLEGRPDISGWLLLLDRDHSPRTHPGALGIAILVNGYWDKDDPAVLADNHGPSMLKQI